MCAKDYSKCCRTWARDNLSHLWIYVCRYLSDTLFHIFPYFDKSFITRNWCFIDVLFLGEAAFSTPLCGSSMLKNLQECVTADQRLYSLSLILCPAKNSFTFYDILHIRILTCCAGGRQGDPSASRCVVDLLIKMVIGYAYYNWHNYLASTEVAFANVGLIGRKYRK